ncbi:MAG: hypothetical protein B6D57_01945 [Candidatus Coatesbacteria bacterium 4484_99]|uniref:O-antigen ligase-related domain-containing protein n=1 Tax=Candidatus Coatesbacteria bacterium 4484_99 TaxID=1970774 RepID=A0A1W9S260_9BACT|nr:MAG: hypothetical protein B6D57_01945 [Candidatus Coatesbacteria bacterium 4484_99]RLC43549.1 MAG: hypothetical protein DRH49_01000 [Candidatus Coatesbacteria bacterium]
MELIVPARYSFKSERVLVIFVILIIAFAIFYGFLTTQTTLRKNIVIFCVMAYLGYAVYKLDVFDFLLLFLIVFLVFHKMFYCKGFLGKTLRGIRLENTLLFWPLLLFMFLGDSALNRKWKIYRTPVDKWIMLFLVSFTMSVIYSFFVGNHWVNILRDSFAYVRFVFLIYVVICVIDRRSKFESFNKFIFILAAFCGVYGLIEYIFFPDPRYGTSELGLFLRTRIRTIFYYTNDYAGYLDSTIPFIFAFATFSKEKSRKTLFWVLLLLLYINMILTFSRASFLTVNFALFIMALIRYKKRAIWILTLFIILIAIIGLNTPVMKRQISVFTGGSLLEQQSNLFRVYEYSHLIQGIAEKPILGAGLGSRTMGRYAPFKDLGHFKRSYRPVMNVYHHHSLVLDVAGRMGLPVMATMSMLCLTLLYAFYKAFKFTEEYEMRATLFGAIGAILSFMPHMIVDNLIDKNTFIYFIFIISIGIVAWRYVYKVED